MILSLCGFMGAGKSTVGKRLSYLLGCRLIDLDAYIVSMVGMTIPQIFASRGEAAFRALECEAAHQITERFNSVEEAKLDAEGMEYVSLVLSLGGGALTSQTTAECISGATCCIYLKCSTELLAARLIGGRSERPLIKGKSREELVEYIGRTMEQREPAYLKASSHTIECDGKSLDEVCEEIISKIVIN